MTNKKLIQQIFFHHLAQQVAQLWQRDCTTLALFSINVQLYSQNHNTAFLSQPMEASGEIYALYLKVLM